MQLTRIGYILSPFLTNDTSSGHSLEFGDSNDSLQICETSLTTRTTRGYYLELPLATPSPPPLPQAIPKIQIRRPESSGGGGDRCDFRAGVLHATDTTMDFISRNALNRNRSFIEHIRGIPGFETSNGRFASVPKTPSRSSPKHTGTKSKYIIGQSSDEDDIEDCNKKVELRLCASYDNPYLTFGMSRGRERQLLLVVRLLSSFITFSDDFLNCS